MTSGRGPAVGRLPAAGRFDAVDALTAQSALRSLGVAGLVVGLPALWSPDVAAYYLLQASLLLAGTLVLYAWRRTLSSWALARGVVVVGALTVSVAALLSGGANSPAYHAYSVAVVGGTWLVLGPRQAMWATVAVLGAGAALTALTVFNQLPSPWLVHSPVAAWFTTSAACALIGVVQWLEMHRLKASNATALEHLAESEAAQRALALGEQRYADVVSTAPGVVFQFEVRADGSRAFTFISEGARLLFERAPAELLADARRLFDMIAGPRERSRVDDTLAASQQTLSAWDVEVEIRTPSDQVRWVRAHALPARLADGTTRWHGFFTDMSERLKTERALRESRAALKQSLSMIQGAFESTMDGLLIVGRSGRVTGHNQKFISLWRVPEVLARTHDVDQLRAHVMRQVADPVAFAARSAEITADADAVSFDTIRLTDGRQYERYSQPQVVDGAVVGRVWSYRDVSARAADEQRRAELEQQLQQAHTLEALGALAGGVAHDFNNLLTIILASAEAAFDEPDPVRHADRLGAIVEAAGRATALVREIREFSQPRAADRAIVTVAGAIGHAVELLRATLPKNLTVDVTLDPHVTMFTNPTHVQQVVINLALNAAQAVGDADGRLAISLDEVSGDAVPEATPQPRASRYARLTVSDTGRGIAADAMPRIFEPLFTTRAAAGSGLGLAVVNGIVRRNHGTVTVDSTPGSGTTFAVFWPAVPPGEVDRGVIGGAPAEAAAAGRRRHIMVVDDEPAIVRVISEGLRRIGYLVTAMTDPREALETFAAGPASFDAVLSDLSMPHLSGATLGRRMLDLRPDTPIVLFTGYSSELSPDEATAAGFRAVLNKPMSTATLAAALHRVLPSPAAV